MVIRSIMLTYCVRKASAQFCGRFWTWYETRRFLCLSRSFVNALFSIAAPFVQEFPWHHLFDADLHQRGGLHHWHLGAPQWDVHPERGIHRPRYCQGNGSAPQVICSCKLSKGKVIRWLIRLVFQMGNCTVWLQFLHRNWSLFLWFFNLGFVS